MNPFEMVVAIVIIVTIGGLLRTKYLAKHGVVEDKKGDKSLLIRQGNGQQRQEIKELKELSKSWSVSLPIIITQWTWTVKLKNCAKNKRES